MNYQCQYFVIPPSMTLEDHLKYHINQCSWLPLAMNMDTSIGAVRRGRFFEVFRGCSRHVPRKRAGPQPSERSPPGRPRAQRPVALMHKTSSSTPQALRPAALQCWDVAWLYGVVKCPEPFSCSHGSLPARYAHLEHLGDAGRPPDQFRAGGFF